jgi:hypothetical protein
MTARDWHADAHEAGELHRQTGEALWRAAYLVARSVEPAKAGRPKIGPRGPITERVSFRDFGEQAGISHQSVARYYATWQAAAVKGLVPEASTLGSGHEPRALGTLTSDQWQAHYPKRALPSGSPTGAPSAVQGPSEPVAPGPVPASAIVPPPEAIIPPGQLPPEPAEVDVLVELRYIVKGLHLIASVSDAELMSLTSEQGVVDFMNAAAKLATRIHSLRKLRAA